MATAVYVLCAVTSLACTGLLWRGYLRSGARLLLWSALCFVLLAANNVLLLVDLSVWTGADLGVWRAASGLAGLCVLLFGLVWEAR